MGNSSDVSEPPQFIVSRLKWFYERNGYVRRQKKDRLSNENSMSYKKGEEVRLIAFNENELYLIQSLLKELGFKYGKPFKKATQYCQPVYGKQEVTRFLQLINLETDG